MRDRETWPQELKPRNGPRIGLVVAVEKEPFEKKYGEKLSIIRGTRIMTTTTEYGELGIVFMGEAGEIMAAAATRHLIDVFKPDIVTNYGVIGACTPDLNPGDLCLVKGVVQSGQYNGMEGNVLKTYQVVYQIAKKNFPGHKKVICASGDRFLDHDTDKAAMHALYGAEICDMELAGIGLTCWWGGVPFFSVKAVADSKKGGVAEYWERKEGASYRSFGLLEEIIKLTLEERTCPF